MEQEIDVRRIFQDGRTQGERDLLIKIVEQLLHIELNPKLKF